MSKYIREVDLLDACVEVEYLGHPRRMISAAKISQLPSIDIVFCKECKYEPICTHSVQHTTHEPTSVTIGYKTVEWCSYGEREGE